MPGYIEKAEEKVFMIMEDGAVLVDPSGGGTSAEAVMRPGEVQRWRILNGRSRANSFVHLNADAEAVELWQIAFDGLTADKRVRVMPNNDEPRLNPAALAPAAGRT